MTLGELKKKSDDLRESLVKLVFSEEQHNLPDLDALRDAISHHARLESEIVELKQKSTALFEQQAELAEIEKELVSTQQALTNADKSFEALHEPLGATAFKAFLRGKLADQPLFYNRKTCADKLVAMKKEHEELQAATGLLRKAKAKAQQAIIWGKIQIEETRAKSLNGKIGHELIQTNSEQMVDCDETVTILTQVADARIKVQEAKQEVEQVHSTHEAKMTELYTTFGLQDIQKSKVLEREIERCKKLVDDKNREEVVLEQSLPDRLLNETRNAVLPSSTLFANVINELRETEIKIAMLSNQKE